MAWCSYAYRTKDTNVLYVIHVVIEFHDSYGGGGCPQTTQNDFCEDQRNILTRIEYILKASDSIEELNISLSKQLLYYIVNIIPLHFQKQDFLPIGLSSL
jgi:hypothetical protein